MALHEGSNLAWHHEVLLAHGALTPRAWGSCRAAFCHDDECIAETYARVHEGEQQAGLLRVQQVGGCECDAYILRMVITAMHACTPSEV